MSKFFKIITPLSVFVVIGVFMFQNRAEAYDYYIIDSATTWTKTQSPIIINKDIIVKVGAVLTIEPGVVVKLRANQFFSNSGTVHASGTLADPIIFTSIKDDEHGGDSNNDGNTTMPSPKDWFQLSVNGGLVNFDNVQILYGGGYSGGNYNVVGVNNNGKINFQNSIITKNGSGVTVSKGVMIINNSSFFGNFDKYAGSTFDAGINVGAQGIVEAANNWWGTSTGPCPFMDLAPLNTNPFAYLPQCNNRPAIFRGVKYVPWLVEEPKQEKIKPVVIVPGIGGSLNMDLFFAEKENNNWKFSTHDYDGLIKAFEAAGYEKNKNLFIAFYDWRKPNAFSAEKYLKPIIDKAKEANGSKKIDVIAHSMGGLVARNYIQGDKYEDDIDNFIMLGTPNHGSSDSYLIWNKAKLPLDWGVGLKLKVNGYLWFKTIVADNTLKRLDVIHQHITSIKELLPIYDYIKNKETDEIVNHSAMNSENINDILENLNNEAGLARLNDKINTRIISGNGRGTINIIPTIKPTDKELAIGYWRDGKPEPDPPLKDSNEGDNRVLGFSAILPDIKTIAINSEHDKLPDSAQKEIFDILKAKKPEGDFISLEIINQLGFWFASPVDVKITAPDGSYIAKDENNLDGATYDSVDEALGFKMVIIENAQAGEYKVELTGIGDGGEYHTAAAFFTKGKDIIKDTAGVIRPGQIITYNVEVGTGGNIEFSTNNIQSEYLLDYLMKCINNSYNQGFIDNNGVRAGLLAHLESAKRKLSNLEEANEKEYNKNEALAIEELQQFAKKVEKYEDKFIYSETADYLIEKIDYIIFNL